MILTAAAVAPSEPKNGPLMLAPPSYVMSANRFTPPITSTNANAGEARSAARTPVTAARPRGRARTRGRSCATCSDSRPGPSMRSHVDQRRRWRLRNLRPQVRLLGRRMAGDALRQHLAVGGLESHAVRFFDRRLDGRQTGLLDALQHRTKIELAATREPPYRAYAHGPIQMRARLVQVERRKRPVDGSFPANQRFAK